MQHLLAPRGESILSLHPLQKLEQALFVLCPLAAVEHHVWVCTTIKKSDTHFFILTDWCNRFWNKLVHFLTGYLSDGLLRLFLRPMLLRMALWFFRASSQMPMLPPEGLLLPGAFPSMPPDAHREPTPSGAHFKK